MGAASLWLTPALLFLLAFGIKNQEGRDLAARSADVTGVPPVRSGRYGSHGSADATIGQRGSDAVVLKGQVRPVAFIVGSGLPLAVIIRIVVDAIIDPTSHNLFPLEIISSLIFAYPPALAGAYLAKWTHRPSPMPSPGDGPPSAG